MNRKQYVIVRGLLTEAERVLVVRDRAQASLEYYELPGGYVEFGRDPAEALVDLFFEQTRIPVVVEAPFRTTSRMSSRDDSQTIEIVYRVRQQNSGLDAASPATMVWIEINDAGYFLSSRIAETVRAGLE